MKSLWSSSIVDLAGLKFGWRRRIVVEYREVGNKGRRLPLLGATMAYGGSQLVIVIFARKFTT